MYVGKQDYPPVGPVFLKPSFFAPVLSLLSDTKGACSNCVHNSCPSGHIESPGNTTTGAYICSSGRKDAWYYSDPGNEPLYGIVMDSNPNLCPWQEHIAG